MGCCFSVMKAKNTPDTSANSLDKMTVQSSIQASGVHSGRHVSLRVYEVLTPSQIEQYRKDKCCTNLIMGVKEPPLGSKRLYVTTDLTTHMYLLKKRKHRMELQASGVTRDDIHLSCNKSITYPALPRGKHALSPQT